MKTDAECEGMIRLLFPDGETDDFNEFEFSKFMSKIGGFKVDDLLKEPNRLREEKTVVVEHTQELAYKNYKTFIQTAECSRDIFDKFSTTEKRLDSLLVKIENLEVQCDNFSKITRNINVNRRLNSLMLTRNAQLLEILELPQLMHNFIQSEQYENALELANYVRRLVVKHPEVPIFKQIESDVEKSWRFMLLQLISQLRTDLQLPKCLQIVGYLRRMQVFSEIEIRLKFLQARDAWFRNCLAGISTQDASHHLTKTIETTRICLFGIVTQYRSVFSDDSRATESGEGLVFYSYLNEKVRQLVSTLHVDLEAGVSAPETLLSQCMYFGQSFSRVGVDFRALLIPVFTECIERRFRKQLDASITAFRQNMDRFTLINKAPGVLHDAGIQEMAPPENLLEFYPLAQFCNDVLVALNDLRLVAPFSLLPQVTDGLNGALETISVTILGFYAGERQALDGNAREMFTRLLTTLSNDLCPYLQKCLGVLYPGAEVAAHLGLSVHEVHSQGLGLIQRDRVLQPLRHLMPRRYESLEEAERAMSQQVSD